MAESVTVKMAFKPASDWAEQYADYTPGKALNRPEKSKELLLLAMIGDGVVGLAAAEGIAGRGHNIPVAGHLISKARSNRYMSEFTIEIGLFDSITRQTDKRKKRADLLEGWFGFLHTTVSPKAAMECAGLYINYMLCHRQVFDGTSKYPGQIEYVKQVRLLEKKEGHRNG
jgi:hypothetical protein